MNRLTLPLAILLALLAAAVPLAAGCGGDDDDDDKAKTTTTAPSEKTYKRDVQRILGTVGTAGTQLGADARSSSSLDGLADALVSFETKVDAAANRLDDLAAPAAAESAQDDLEQVLREMADGVEGSILAARTGNRDEFRTQFRIYQNQLNSEFRRRLTEAGRRIDQALAGS